MDGSPKYILEDKNVLPEDKSNLMNIAHANSVLM